MGVIIPESDMEFGEYKEKQVFRIEKSNTIKMYKKL